MDMGPPLQDDTVAEAPHRTAQQAHSSKHVGIAHALVSDDALVHKSARALNGCRFRSARDPSARVTRICATASGRPTAVLYLPACLCGYVYLSHPF